MIPTTIPAMRDEEARRKKRRDRRESKTLAAIDRVKEAERKKIVKQVKQAHATTAAAAAGRSDSPTPIVKPPKREEKYRTADLNAAAAAPKKIIKKIGSSSSAKDGGGGGGGAGAASKKEAAAAAKASAVTPVYIDLDPSNPLAPQRPKDFVTQPWMRKPPTPSATAPAAASLSSAAAAASSISPMSRATLIPMKSQFAAPPTPPISAVDRAFGFGGARVSPSSAAAAAAALPNANRDPIKPRVRRLLVLGDDQLLLTRWLLKHWSPCTNTAPLISGALDRARINVSARSVGLRDYHEIHVTTALSKEQIADQNTVLSLAQRAQRGSSLTVQYALSDLVTLRSVYARKLPSDPPPFDCILLLITPNNPLSSSSLSAAQGVGPFGRACFDAGTPVLNKSRFGDFFLATIDKLRPLLERAPAPSRPGETAVLWPELKLLLTQAYPSRDFDALMLEELGPDARLVPHAGKSKTEVSAAGHPLLLPMGADGHLLDIMATKLYSFDARPVGHNPPAIPAPVVYSQHTAMSPVDPPTRRQQSQPDATSSCTPAHHKVPHGGYARLGDFRGCACYSRRRRCGCGCRLRLLQRL